MNLGLKGPYEEDLDRSMKIAHYLARSRREDGGVVPAVLDLGTALSGQERP